MSGLAMIIVEANAVTEALRAELGEMGFSESLPASEGEVLCLPRGTFGRAVDAHEPMKPMNTFYHQLVDVMRKHNLHGRYMVAVSRNIAFTCGEL